jgi:hypothetical protein
MQVKVINVFESNFQEQKEFKYTPKEPGSKEIIFAAKPARSAVCALVEVLDGSGCRVTVEFPVYTKEIHEGDVLHVECKDLQLLDRFWAVRNITRHLPKITK